MSSSEPFAGGTQSSKSFRGLTQSEQADSDENEVIADYSGFLRDTLNLSPPNVTEPQPHCSYNLSKRSGSYEKESASSGVVSPARKRNKLNADATPINQEPIDYDVGDSGNELNDTRQTPKTDNTSKRRTKKPKKKSERQPRRYDVINDFSPERQDIEDGFYLRMTEAARSITDRFQSQPKNKEKPSDQNAIINHFCKMQKHMLRTINEDARREYMKECKNKLFDLCALEQHIM